MLVIPDRLKKIIKIVTNKEFRRRYNEYKRLLNLPRFEETKTDVYGKNIKIGDAHSFLFSYNEIVNLEIYKFECAANVPFIIDCGSNIGLAIIYFKKLFPTARILSFEPDDRIFQMLQYNINLFNLPNVELIKKACWNTDTILDFFSEGADGGRKMTMHDESKKSYPVDATRLKNFLHKEVDLLKIDIEGAEFVVLNDIQDKLHLIRRIFIEFHSIINQEQMLPELISILKKAGFRLYISSTGSQTQQPFMYRPKYLGIENQVNIYGFRN